MLVLMLVAIVLGSRRGLLSRRDGAILIACYPIFLRSRHSLTHGRRIRRTL